MRKTDRMSELPEATRYTKYYEHDGMLRAYANRAMLLAMIFGVLAMGSLAFAMYVRIQPPTVIRVDKDGNALVVGGPRGGNVATIRLSADDASADRLNVVILLARGPPTTKALPSLSTRITVGGCMRTYTANPREPIASTPKIIAKSMARFA